MKRGNLGQLFINHPFGKYHIVDFASNLFRNFNVILKQGEETIPKQGKASSAAEALADTQAELEAHSALPSAGKESGKERINFQALHVLTKSLRQKAF